MKPVPETIRALSELSRLDGVDYAEELQLAADRVQQLAPECVGLSVAWLDHDMAFTLVASHDEIALFDALQYLEGGPCVDAVDRNHGIATTRETLLDEDRWHLFARATAAAGVRSTLTLPIVEDGRTVGSINFYGATPNTFGDLHQELADIFGAWAPGAISNADLAFRTRQTAAGAPTSMRTRATIARAVSVLMAQYGLDSPAAHRRLEAAAHRADVSLLALAESVLRHHR